MIVVDRFDRELGIRTRVHDTGDKVSIQKTYDAQPFLEQAAAERASSEGESWGHGRKVGTIPMAALGELMRREGGLSPDSVLAYLKANPGMVSFSKFLK